MTGGDERTAAAGPAVLSLVFPAGLRGPEWKRFRADFKAPGGWLPSWEALPDPLPAGFAAPGERPAAVLLWARAEADYPLLVRWLFLQGVDRDRGKNRRSSPLILAHFTGAGINPEPLAPFLDGVVLRDPAGVLKRLCTARSRSLESARSRAARMPEVYVPEGYRVEYAPEGPIRRIRPRPSFPARVSCPRIPRIAWWRFHFPGFPDGRSASRQGRGILWPVAGGEKLRSLLGRPASEEHYLDDVARLLRRGARDFSLYFLVGLPGEEEEDRRGIVRLVKRLRHATLRFAGNSSAACSVTVNLTCFSPRPFTPVQWEGMSPPAALHSLLRTLRARLQEVPGVRVAHDLPKWTYFHGLLVRGDRRTAELLRAAARRGGDWGTALSEVNLNPDFYALRRRPLEEVLPWDHLDAGPVREELESGARAWRRAAGASCGFSATSSFP